VYEGAKEVLAYAARPTSANSAISSDVETPARREKTFVTLVWRQRLVEGPVGGRKD
jgi:hypothetical protein